MSITDSSDIQPYKVDVTSGHYSTYTLQRLISYHQNKL